MNDPKQGDVARFMALVSRHLKLADQTVELEMNSNLDGLGLDSQAALSLVLDLEETFGVVFHDSMFTEENFATPGSLWQALLSLRH